MFSNSKEDAFFFWSNLILQLNRLINQKQEDRINSQTNKGQDGEPVQPIEADEGGTNQVDALRFEVILCPGYQIPTLVKGWKLLHVKT